MKQLIFLFFTLIFGVMLTSCLESEQDKKLMLTAGLTKDFVMNQAIRNIRLADGAPINIEITYRWSVANVDSFISSFTNPIQFDSLILKPRAREIADLTAVGFKNIDSVFTSQRELFVETVRQELHFGLGGNEANIKEVIITNVIFPARYTSALEDISLKKKEIERIKQQAIVDKAQAEANKEKAEYQGKVRIAEAEANGRLEKINATTEESRRLSQLAKAETEKQLSYLKTEAQANQKKIIAKAELDNQREILELERQDLVAKNKVEIENKRLQNELELDNVKKITLQNIDLEKLKRNGEFDQEIQFANLCNSNPSYANFLISRELASQVEIAILPTGAELSVFEDVIKKSLYKNVQ